MGHVGSLDWSRGIGLGGDLQVLNYELSVARIAVAWCERISRMIKKDNRVDV
jgi:hypothetical protein